MVAEAVEVIQTTEVLLKPMVVLEAVELELTTILIMPLQDQLTLAVVVELEQDLIQELLVKMAVRV